MILRNNQPAIPFDIIPVIPFGYVINYTFDMVYETPL